ncbi:HAMP domain-containing sensor histidine kinase [Chelativorans sp. AA-79]|uniref:sensor histidine kinase n=1 Tax=Chelativorans sp. AA-79 TaxID=3028735 RepID=UPI0023F9F1A6|nr:HAMP domain-containing sensor histidine kinase [Chelativorans sp. AA-79]WEX07246.1 HAMP domain-containing sensor histidine kinase [Chelativorans sp. AA-79]
MALNQSHIADKFIVDRRKPHRNSEVAEAVRRTRNRLSQAAAGNPDFDREMLKIHARAILDSAPAIFLLLFVVGGVGMTINPAREMLVWSILIIGGYASLFSFAWRVDRLALAEISTRGLRSWFLILHFLTGVGWAYLVSLDCRGCGFDHFPVVVAIVLLMMIAATALVASSLHGAILATFALPVAAYAFLYIQLPLDVEPIMAGLLILSLPFFSHVASQRNHAAVNLLGFRSENDALIAELETAKAVSDEARRRAEEANLAKSRFLASMSHELRTPLNAILGFSEVMAKEVLGPIQNETYREYAKDVHESGQHLLELINEILDLSRIEAGRYQLNEEPLELADIVQECCRMMELKIKAKGITLAQQYEPTLLRLLADERALRQITLNLLSNAVKFTPSGGEILVRVGWTAGGGQYISVKDNGPGIPEDEMPVVLSAFGQGSIAIKGAEQGTGLGLPIVQGLANLHGGVLKLKSKLREGTEGIVAFPRSRVMEKVPAAPKHPAKRAVG